MNPGRTGVLDYVALAARLGLGGMFIYMGMNKALHPEAFLKLVREYEMVSSPFLLNTIGATLPWFEVFCGLLLVAGIAVRGAALVLAGLLVPFSIIVAMRALDISEASGKPYCTVRFDCGCGNGEVLICGKLLENALLLAVSLWLLAGRGRLLALRHSLRDPAAASTGQSILPPDGAASRSP